MLNIEQLAATGCLLDNQYKLIRPLSTEGGTADVWLALDMNTVRDASTVGDITHMKDEEIEKFGLIVAIKIYRPQNALDIEGEQRFRDEYMIVFNCHHTNLIHPTHFSIFQERPYLVMPYCKLGSSETLAGTLLEPDTIWKYIGDVASGLAYLHAQHPPIIHQDIKPGNVLIDDDLNYSITDFGISSKTGSSASEDGYDDEERSGTLAYMAPERYHEGAVVAPPSDIWAFGATLTELITGSVPFGEEGGWTQVEQQAAMPSLPDSIPADIVRLIHACLSPDPDSRPTAAQLAECARAKQYPIRHKKPWGVIAAAIAAVAIAAVAAIFILGGNKEQTVKEIIVEAPEAPEPTPPEEVFDHALAALDSNIPDSVRTGAELMDSLSNIGFLPAKYELAFTYGWFSDQLSLSRKAALDIDVFDSGDYKYLPRDDKWSTKAMELFTAILEQHDTTYARQTAEAAYRMALYYQRPNNLLKSKEQKSREYLVEAHKWALIAQDEEQLTRIERNMGRMGIKVNK